MREFNVDELLGYRNGLANIDHKDYAYDLGMFDLAGSKRRIYASDKQGKYFRSAVPKKGIENAVFGFPARDGLERLIEDEQITRLGPVRRRDGVK